MNAEQTGFYRVNYERENWNKLIHQLNTDHTVHSLNWNLALWCFPCCNVPIPNAFLCYMYVNQVTCLFICVFIRWLFIQIRTVHVFYIFPSAVCLCIVTYLGLC